MRLSSKCNAHSRVRNSARLNSPRFREVRFREISRKQRKDKLTKWQRRAVWLREHPVVITLEAVGLISLVFAAFIFFNELRERQDERIARAWQLITTVASGNSGKIGALEYLNSQSLCLPLLQKEEICWKKRHPLIGINLSKERHNPFLNEMQNGKPVPVFLRNVQLADADLEETNLNGAALHSATFTRAYFFNSELIQAVLESAVFNKAELHNTKLLKVVADGADFSEAVFDQSPISGKLEKTILWKTEFKKLTIENTQFNDAKLSGTLFKNVILRDSSFKRAKLLNATFLDTSMKNVDFSHAVIEWSNFSGANIDQTKIPYFDTNLLNVSSGAMQASNLFFEAKFDEYSARTLNIQLSQLIGAYVCDSRVTIDVMKRYPSLDEFINFACVRTKLHDTKDQL